MAYKTEAQLLSDINTYINTNGINDITGAELNQVLVDIKDNLRLKHIQLPLDLITVTNADIGKVMMLGLDGLAKVYQCSSPGPGESADNIILGVLLEIVGGDGLIGQEGFYELPLALNSDPTDITNPAQAATNKIYPASEGKIRVDGTGQSFGVALESGVAGDTIKVLFHRSF